MASQASRVNQAFYEQITAGRRDYWRKMAACRHRVEIFLGELRRDNPRSVIDLGCGDGALLEEIAAILPDATLTGVDISLPQIERNHEALSAVRWHVCDFDGDFALRGQPAVDAIIASEVVEHLDNPSLFLASALTLAHATSRLYISTQSGPLRETERRVGHRRHYAAAELRQLLLQSGWMPLRVWNTGYPFHNLSKWYANLNPDRSLAQFDEKAYGFRENAICWALRQAFRLNSRTRGAQLFAIAMPHGA
jgi:2-polyprenyl-3-methyl-5-hydroxy-6-metoxy-1,4-benzoquinol methylase